MMNLVQVRWGDEENDGSAGMNCGGGRATAGGSNDVGRVGRARGFTNAGGGDGGSDDARVKRTRMSGGAAPSNSGFGGVTQDSARMSRHSGGKGAGVGREESDFGFDFDEEDDEALAAFAREMSAGAKRGIAMPVASHVSSEVVAQPSQRAAPARSPAAALVGAPNSRNLDFWGLPAKAKAALNEKGVTELYPWQAECLSRPGIMDGSENLLYSAPTSGGKSLVADIILARRFAAKPGSMAMFVLPFVALCEERANSLEAFFNGTDFRMKRMYGGRGGAFPSPDPKTNTLLVLTPERANQVTSRLLEENRLHELSCVIVDELHLIQDSDRGATMELFLTKLVYASGMWRQNMSGDASVQDASQTTFSVGRTEGNARDSRTMQIVGMSASIPNLGSLADWLYAQLYITDFRPVRLDVCVKVGCEIFHPESKAVIRTLMNRNQNAHNAHIAELAQETIDENGSVLVFCSSRKACKDVADELCKMMQCDQLGVERSEKPRAELVAGYEDLLGEKSEVSKYIKVGIAFHHAGLSREEADSVAAAYKSGVVRVLCCTSTLATGVNLPARRVILRDTNMGGTKLSGRDIQQMMGRAGRAGLDASGSAIIFCPKPSELDDICQRSRGPSDELTSAVAEAGMRRIMLEAVAAGLVKTPSDVQAYIKCTLLSALNDFNESVRRIATDSLKWCQQNALLTWNAKAYLWSASPLGISVAGGMMPLDLVQPIIQDIKKARMDLVLSTPLHLLFLLTIPPVIGEEGVPTNSHVYRSIDSFAHTWTKLSSEQLRIATKIGISDSYIRRLQMNRRDITKEHACERFTCQRFHLALVLSDLIQEVPVEEICSRYGYRAFDVGEKQRDCARFASYIAAICGTLGWSDMESLINRISDRITAGAQEEILELTKIPHIGIHRARALYAGGITTPKAIVTLGSVDKIASVLKQYNKSNMAPAAVMRAAREILMRAKEIVAEQSREEREEAEALLAELNELEADMAIEDAHEVQGELDVDAATGVILLRRHVDVEKFLTAWQSSQKYSIIFQPPRSKPLERRGAFERPSRIAVALNPKSVFIAKILHEKLDVDAQDAKSQPVGVRIERIMDILATQGPLKFTVDLQSQLCNIVEGREKYSERLFSFAQPCVDIRIASWLLRPNAAVVHTANGLPGLALGKDPSEPLRDLFRDDFDARETIQVASFIRERKAEHLGNLARATATCHAMSDFLWRECERRELLRPLLDIEMPFVSAMVAMQTTRLPFSCSIMQDQIASMNARLEALEEYAKRQSWLDTTNGVPNRAFTENAYLVKCLYEHLRLTPPPGSELACTKTGAVRQQRCSTAKDVLQTLHDQCHHPFPLLIVEHRSVYKRLGIADELRLLAEGNEFDSGGRTRVRCSMHQTNTETGRLTHDEPNLHTLPKDLGCDERFHGLKAPTISLRSAFATTPDKLFLCADYSQLELRVLAHITGDATLRQALWNPEPVTPEDDPFMVLASKWRRVPMSQVTKLDRTKVKNLTYGILYGSGAGNFEREFKVSNDEAKAQIRRLNDTLPRVQQWKETVLHDARMEKPLARVTTIGRRHRYLPELLSKDSNERSRAERQAINTVCQGSASDIFKSAVIRLMSILRDKRILDRCRLVLTVHDECVFEVDAKSAKAIANIVRDGLESIASHFRLAVPLPVKVKLGPSLAEDALREVPRLSHSKPPSLAPTPATSPIKPTPR